MTKTKGENMKAIIFAALLAAISPHQAYSDIMSKKIQCDIRQQTFTDGDKQVPKGYLLGSYILVLNQDLTVHLSPLTETGVLKSKIVAFQFQSSTRKVRTLYITIGNNPNGGELARNFDAGAYANNALGSSLEAMYAAPKEKADEPQKRIRLWVSCRALQN